MSKSKLERTICRRIRLLREQAGLTQAELAEMAGLSEETVGAMERGKYVPSINTLEKIAASFHLELYQVFRPEERKRASAFDHKIEKMAALLRVRDIGDVERAERLLRLLFKWVDERSR